MIDSIVVVMSVLGLFYLLRAIDRHDQAGTDDEERETSVE